MFDSANCTVVPSETSTDAGVAGAGVLLSFIITAGLALILSSLIVQQEFRGKSESKILRKLLSSFSDQQIITGIAIQSVALAKIDNMVPYHVFIIWMLSVLSTATHLSTLLALVNDFKRDWVLRWLRQLLMFINLILSCVLGVFVLVSVMRDMPQTLPIACVWQVPAKASPSNAAISVVGTIAVMVGSFLVFILGVWHLHSRGWKWLKFVKLGTLVLLAAFAAGAAIRVIQVSQAFGSPSVPLSNMGEKEWSFGQLLGMLLLILPLISALEIIRGEINVPSPVADDQNPLIGQQYKPGRESFQPNPFFGSQTHMLRNISK